MDKFELIDLQVKIEEHVSELNDEESILELAKFLGLIESDLSHSNESEGKQ